jgi:nucleotide-binding universal stress UspA family protein
MYKHILLPVDDSELSLKAARETLKYAKSVGARVTAIHVIAHGRLVIDEGLSGGIVRQLKKEYEDTASNAAKDMLAKLEERACKLGVRFDSAVVVGDHPHQEIIEHAEKNGNDLIMMASHGRRALQSLLLGSETIKVLTHCKIPVLVVR